MQGIPRTPFSLAITTMRPRPAARIEGSSALVSATGPNRLVANSCCHTSRSSSSTQPTAVIPALCTTASGAPTASRMALAAFVIDAGSVRSSCTPINRELSAGAPVASSMFCRPISGVRIAATTRQPALYRWAAEASPSPREAPVMTTLRDSPMADLQRAAWTVRNRIDGAMALRSAPYPRRPHHCPARSPLAGRVIEALHAGHFRVIPYSRSAGRIGKARRERLHRHDDSFAACRLCVRQPQRPQVWVAPGTKDTSPTP